MSSARTILLPFVILGLAIGLVLLNDVVTSFRIDYGRGGRPYDADRISGVTLTGGGNLGPTLYVPADYFRCIGIGQINCGGEIAGERLTFQVWFDGGWSCNAEYASQPITCQGGFGSSDDIRTAHVSISKAEFQLSSDALQSEDLFTVVNTDKPIRTVWLTIGTIFIVVMAQRIYRLTQSFSLRNDSSLRESGAANLNAPH